MSANETQDIDGPHGAAAAPVCARAFKVRVRPGQEAAYERYLQEAVEPIDAMAHAADVFQQMLALRPEDPQAGWSHCRVFLFRDLAQRERFTAAMAEAAARFDGSEAARARRVAYAELLREKVGSSDYRVGA